MDEVKKHCPKCGKFMKKVFHFGLGIYQFVCPSGHVIIVDRPDPIIWAKANKA